MAAGHSHGRHGGSMHGGNGTHPHSPAPASYGRAFALGIGLNLVFVIVEGVFGFLANSSALLADAGHNLSDVLGLVIAWTGTALARRAPTSRYTFGLRGATIHAALVNALFLIAAVGAIGYEAVQRFSQPVPVASTIVIVVALIGIAVNGATAMLFAGGGRDVNIRGAFLHMVADAAVSAGVVLAGIGIMLTGATWLDPATSLVICLVILWSTWSLFREALRMSLLGVPSHVDVEAVRNFLAGLPGVGALHDLHVWPLGTNDTALTCHLVMPAGSPGDRFLFETAHDLQHRFEIGHATFQIETGNVGSCSLEHSPF